MPRHRDIDEAEIDALLAEADEPDAPLVSDLFSGDDAEAEILLSEEEGDGEARVPFGAFHGEDEGDLDDASDDDGPAPTRRAFASKLRRQAKGQGTDDERYEFGFLAGYKQSLLDQGADKGVVDEMFGNPGVIRAVGKGLGGLAKVVKGFAREVIGEKTAEQRARELGRGTRESVSLPEEREVGRRLGAGLGEALGLPSGTGTGEEVVADATELPDVYVAEPDLDSLEGEAGEQLGEAESFGGLSGCDRFGATARFGFVGHQRRQGARKAAERSLAKAEQILGRVRPGRLAALVEDRDAEPVMSSDGTISDAVYGRLCPVPCPGCAQVGKDAAYKGAAEDCLVCAGFGAILVPENDLDAYGGLSRYGVAFLIPLLASAAGAAGGKLAFSAWKKGKLFPKVKARLEGVEAKKKEERATEIDASAPGVSAKTEAGEGTEGEAAALASSIDAELEDLEKMGLVRVIAPGSLLERRR